MSSQTQYAKNGEVSVAYETFGEATGEPLLLFMGLDSIIATQDFRPTSHRRAKRMRSRLSSECQSRPTLRSTC